MPSETSTVTSLYGFRKLNGKAARMHNGIDLRAKMGDPVYAYKDGIVTQGWEGNYGTVVLTHQNGLVTRYLHNSKSLVTKGQKVKAGDQIALAGGRGPSGVNEYVPHIHFETLSNGKHVNPLEYLLASKFNLTLDDKRSAVAPLTVAKTWDGKTSHDLTGTPDMSSEESAPIETASATIPDINPLPVTATKTVGPSISEAGGPDLDKRQNEINDYRQALKRKEYIESVAIPLERSSRILEESYKVQVTMSKLLEEIRDKVSVNPMNDVGSSNQSKTNISAAGNAENPIEKIAMAKPIVALSKR